MTSNSFCFWIIFFLIQLLSNLDTQEVGKILNKKNNHRFFHILNRNIENVKFTFEDIKKAFLKQDYHDGNIKEIVVLLNEFNYFTDGNLISLKKEK